MFNLKDIQKSFLASSYVIIATENCIILFQLLFILKTIQDSGVATESGYTPIVTSVTSYLIFNTFIRILKKLNFI